MFFINWVSHLTCKRNLTKPICVKPTGAGHLKRLACSSYYTWHAFSVYFVLKYLGTSALYTICSHSRYKYDHLLDGWRDSFPVKRELFVFQVGLIAETRRSFIVMQYAARFLDIYKQGNLYVLSIHFGHQANIFAYVYRVYSSGSQFLVPSAAFIHGTTFWGNNQRNPIFIVQYELE